jgi:hypothetical protein
MVAANGALGPAPGAEFAALGVASACTEEVVASGTAWEPGRTAARMEAMSSAAPGAGVGDCVCAVCAVLTSQHTYIAFLATVRRSPGTRTSPTGIAGDDVECW